jgi:hypothetical protein
MCVHQVLKRDAILFSKDSFPENFPRVELIAITETARKTVIPTLI